METQWRVEGGVSFLRIHCDIEVNCPAVMYREFHLVDRWMYLIVKKIQKTIAIAMPNICTLVVH